MATVPSTGVLSISERLYRLLLRLYPAAFRQEYGVSMAQLFQDCSAEAYRRGGLLAVVGWWCFALGDLAATVPAEHISQVAQPCYSRLRRWGGPASMLAGGMWSVACLLESLSLQTCPLAFVPPLLFLLLLVGLAGLYAQCIAGWARLGNTGFALGFIGLATNILIQGLERWFGIECRWPITMFGLVAFFLGLILIGIAALRNHIMPRWNAVPLFTGMLGLLAGFLVELLWNASGNWYALLFVPFGLGWVVLGYALGPGRGTSAKPPLMAAG